MTKVFVKISPSQGEKTELREWQKGQRRHPRNGSV